MHVNIFYDAISLFFGRKIRKRKRPPPYATGGIKILLLSIHKTSSISSRLSHYQNAGNTVMDSLSNHLYILYYTILYLDIPLGHTQFWFFFFKQIKINRVHSVRFKKIIFEKTSPPILLSIPKWSPFPYKTKSLWQLKKKKKNNKIKFKKEKKGAV
jgi:hypothetical protein